MAIPADMIDPQEAPTPLMHPAAGAAFEKLREAVRIGSGVDFLARCGDVHRPADFHSSKDGVADRSWHKTGRAFDYDQTSTALVIVSEPRTGKQYFCTYLFCKKQDGSQGVKKTVRDYRGGSASGYLRLHRRGRNARLQTHPRLDRLAKALQPPRVLALPI